MYGCHRFLDVRRIIGQDRLNTSGQSLTVRPSDSDAFYQLKKIMEPEISNIF